MVFVISPRIQQELDLLRKFYPDLEFIEQGLWVRILNFPLPQDKPWNRKTTDVAFQIPIAYPGTPPYGIYVPSGLTYDGAPPQNYQDRANQQPPFSGQWGIFSWSPADGQWKTSSDMLTGSNLLNFVRSFADRFREGA